MRECFFLFILGISTACSSTQPLQGVKGQVFWISGNQMPGPEANRSAQYGVQREIHIYEKTTIQEATMSADGFFTDIQTRLVTTITSKANGSYKIKLPAGQYSIFIKEPNGLYANLFDKDNTINLVVVKENQYTWLPITIDYQAAY